MLLRILAELARNPNPLQVLQQQLTVLPLTLLLFLVPLVISLTCHEAAHAWVANKLGDSTAKDAGRVSLNPLRHLHPIGSLMLLVVGFGFARPVPFKVENFRIGRTRGAALVGLAGPVTNISLAMIALTPVDFGLVNWHSPIAYPVPFVVMTPQWIIADIIGYFVMVNLLLATVNLIPIAPLDGSRLIGFFLPDRFWPWLVRYEVLGVTILLPLIAVTMVLDLLFGGQRISTIILPLANNLSNIVVGKPLF